MTSPIFKIEPDTGTTVGGNISLPKNPANIIRSYLLNGSSSNLLVNGSSSTVTFSFSADASNDIRISSVCFVMTATNIVMNGASFGPIDALTNGVLLRVDIDSTVTNLLEVKLSEDILFTINPSFFLDRHGAKDVVIYNYGLGGAVTLTANSSDKVEVLVRDNLIDSRFQFYRAMVFGAKV